MKVYKYRPGVIKTDDGESKDSPFKGVIEIEVPTYRERLELVKTLNIDPKQTSIDNVCDLMKTIEKHVRSVDLKYGKDQKVDSIEDLGYYQEGTELVNELGQIVIGGIPLGKA